MVNRGVLVNGRYMGLSLSWRSLHELVALCFRGCRQQPPWVRSAGFLASARCVSITTEVLIPMDHVGAVKIWVAANRDATSAPGCLVKRGPKHPWKPGK